MLHTLNGHSPARPIQNAPLPSNASARRRPLAAAGPARARAGRQHGRRRAHREGALPRRLHRPLPDGRGLVPAPGPARPGARPGPAAPDLARRLDADHGAQRLERRRQLGRQPARRRGLVPQGLPPPEGHVHHELGGALRVGQLPGTRLSQRQADRHARGRLPALRGPARGRPQDGREPPGRAGGQPPHRHGPAAARRHRQRHPGRRLVELRRAAARGLPAQGRPHRHLELRRPARSCPAAPATPPCFVTATLHNVSGRKLRGGVPRLGRRSGGALPPGEDQPGRLPAGLRAGDDRQPAAVGARRPAALPREGRLHRRRPHRRGLRRAHRDPLDQGEGRPAPDQRRAHHAARRERARGGAGHRRRAHRRPGPHGVRRAPAARRDPHPLALPAQPAVPRDGGPRRDHGLGRDPDVPHERRGAEAGVGAQQGPHRHPGDDPARPEPPVGAHLVDRQREPVAAPVRPGALHPGRARPDQADGPHPPDWGSTSRATRPPPRSRTTST